LRTQEETRITRVTGGGIYSATGGNKVKESHPVATGEGMVEYKQVPQWLYKKVPQWLPTGMGFIRTVAGTVAVVIHFDWRQQGVDGGALEQKGCTRKAETEKHPPTG
jgi:hypothetical protein